MRKSLFVNVFFLCVIWGGTLHAQKRAAILPPVEPVTVFQLKRIIVRDSGRVVLVNAWATWCKPCKDEMPNLLKLSEHYQAQKFTLLLVSADDFDQLDTVVKPMLGKIGVDFLTYIVHDSTDDAFITGMNPEWNGALPTSFLFDKEGKLDATMTGERTYEQFDAAISRLLSRTHD